MAARRFVGPEPPAASEEYDDPNALLQAFATSQRVWTRVAPAWCNHKVERKAVWQRLGVAPSLIVPTLYSGTMRDGEGVEGAEWVDDGEGGFTPCLDVARPDHIPDDPNCRERLRALLLTHGQLVVKPVRGRCERGCSERTSDDMLLAPCASLRRPWAPTQRASCSSPQVRRP